MKTRLVAALGCLVTLGVVACSGATTGVGGNGGTNGGTSGGSTASSSGGTGGAGSTASGGGGTTSGGGTASSSGFSSGGGATSGGTSSGTSSGASSGGGGGCPSSLPSVDDPCTPGTMCTWPDTQCPGCTETGTCVAVQPAGTSSTWLFSGICTLMCGLMDAGSSPASCPPAQPSSGSPCAAEGLTCEWGSNPDPSCDPQATCTGGSWQPVTSGGICAGGTGPQCPATFADVPLGQACTPGGTVCDYPQGRCACSFPLPSTEHQWYCQLPEPGCPMPRPDLGTPCMPEGQECDYGTCVIPGGTAQTCTGGVWVESGVACPG